MNYSNQIGIVIFPVFLLVIILALFAMSKMQAFFLLNKELNKLIIKHQKFYALELVAKHLINKYQQNLSLNCVEEENDPNLILKKLQQNKGCLLNSSKHDYIYLIENLKSFPCVQILFQGKLYSSVHFRVNVMTKDSSSQFLQLRIAKKDIIMPCELNPRIIHEGVISWRYLNSG